MVTREKGYKEEKDYGEIFGSVLDEATKNSINRQDIFSSGGSNANGVESSLKVSLEDRISDNFYHSIEICSISETPNNNCDIDKSKLNDDEKKSLEKNDIYISERIIGPDANYNSANFNLIKIKLYVWGK